MPKKSFKPSHIELRGRAYYAVLYVPADVQHLLNRTKFSRSTQTGDVTLAEKRAQAFVLGWQAQIETARFEVPDPIVGEALDLYREYRRPDLARTTIEEIIEERVDEIAVNDPYKAKALHAIATGKNRPLSALLSEWAKEELGRGLAKKTVDQMLADVSQLANDFRSANLIDERTASIWIKTVASGRNLSASSVTRMVGFCRNFFSFYCFSSFCFCRCFLKAYCFSS